MKCDDVQEKLSAFLDNEESTDEIEEPLSHLYGCSECQNFFNDAIKLRSLAHKDQVNFPPGLDEAMNFRTMKAKRGIARYRVKVPAYVLSIAAVVLIALSFTFGFMVQGNVQRKEMTELMKSLPGQVVYSMPTQVVYPVMNREIKGGVR